MTAVLGFGPGISVLFVIGGCKFAKRQEGSGVGNGVRLHRGENALKDKESQERIQHEIGLVSSGRNKASGGLEKPEDAGGRCGWDPATNKAAVPGGNTLKGTEPHGRSRLGHRAKIWRGTGGSSAAGNSEGGPSSREDLDEI